MVFAFSIKKDQAVDEWINYEQRNSKFCQSKVKNHQILTKSFSLLSADTFTTKSKTYASK